MLTCSQTDRFTTRVFAGLVVSVAIAFGSLMFAVSNLQIVA
jgi:hypothetical protein